MKSVLAICCLAIFAKAANCDPTMKPDDTLAEHIKPCAEELELTSAEVDKFHELELEGEERIKIGCLRACVMKRFKLLEDGKVKPENMQEYVEKMFSAEPEHIAKNMEMLKTCAEEVKEGEDECDFAFEYTRCLMMKSAE